MKPSDEHEADVLLQKWAKDHNVSLREVGIIDHRRERTIREREIPFASYFVIRKRRS